MLIWSTRSNTDFLASDGQGEDLTFVELTDINSWPSKAFQLI